MADVDGAWRRRGLLLALGTCLPARLAHANTVHGESDGLAELVAAMTIAMVIGALGGSTYAPGLRPSPTTRRDRLGRWLARCGAALVLASACIVVYGATVETPSWWDEGLTALFGLYLSMGGGFVIGHAARLARGSPRSWWLAQLGAVGGMAALTIALGWDLRGGDWALAVIAIAAVISSLLVGSIAASRADVATAARAHGRTLRIALLFSATIVAGVGLWMRTMGPQDLARSDVSASPSGPWVMVWGEARWPARYEADYLMNVQTGRFVRHGGWISEDGRVAVWWPGSEDWERALPLFVRRLDSSDLGSHRLRSARADNRAWADVVLSPSGRFLLVHEREQFVVIDVETDHVTKRLDDVTPLGLRAWRLDDGGHLRLLLAPRTNWKQPSHRVELHDEDPEHQRLRVRGVVVAPSDMIDAKVDWMSFLDDERLRIAWRGLDRHRRLTLHDARDGRQLAIIADGDHWTPMTAMTLADRRLVHPGQGHESLEVLSPDGSLERIIEMPRANDTWFVGEESPGRIVVHASDHGRRRVMLVDIDEGEVCAIAADLEPVDRAWNVDYRVGTLATRLFRGTSDANGGELIEVDWDTGARRVVLPR